MLSKYRESIEYDLNHSTYGKQIMEAYTIGEEIYRSEYSHVFKLTDKATGLLYILKANKLQEGITFEPDNAKKIQHEKFVSLLDAGESEHFLYTILNYVEGDNLESIIEKRGPMDVSQAIELVKQISDALRYIHTLKDAPIVFRDLKPSNIMLTPEGKVVLIDTTTIRSIKKNQDTDTYYIGSKGYTAPEAHGFSQSTVASDIYSLGSTLFYLLTGNHPNNGIQFAKQLKVQSVKSAIIKKTILKATMFNPQQRYKTVDAFLNALDTKKRLLIASAISLSVLLLLLLGVCVFGFVQANRPFQVEDIRTYTDIDMASLIEIKSGLKLTLKDEIINIQLDRTAMDEKIKDFKYITVGTADRPFYYEDLNQEIFLGLIMGYGFEAYNDRDGFNSVLEDRDYMYLGLYDAEKRPIAYYILNKVKDNIAQ